MDCKRISGLNRGFINEFIKQHWYTTTMIVRGKEIDMAKTEGFYVAEGDSIIGLITYIMYDDTLEIISLDSLRKCQGIGSQLLDTVVREAQKVGCKKIVLVTTNDNIYAMKFYQKRGFDMAHFFRNSMEAARKRKPEIPFIGENSIPLRHEIEFEWRLSFWMD